MSYQTFQPRKIEAHQYPDQAPKGAIQTIVDQTSLILPIAELIDLDKERDRLKKEFQS